MKRPHSPSPSGDEVSPLSDDLCASPPSPDSPDAAPEHGNAAASADIVQLPVPPPPAPIPGAPRRIRKRYCVFCYQLVPEQNLHVHTRTCMIWLGPCFEDNDAPLCMNRAVSYTHLRAHETSAHL
eukprot:710947-Alexandrium_andersonii.AAC.1